MSMMQEFKEFALKGNVVDMAVGIIIGAAFGTIVSSLVADVIMPPIGVLMGGVDFSNLQMVIQEAGADTEEVAIRYGAFIQSVLDFLIVAMAIFMAIKAMNSLKRDEEETVEEDPKEAEVPKNEQLLAEIRDLLKDRA